LINCKSLCDFVITKCSTWSRSAGERRDLRGERLWIRSGPEGSSLKGLLSGDVGHPGRIQPIFIMLNNRKAEFVMNSAFYFLLKIPCLTASSTSMTTNSLKEVDASPIGLHRSYTWAFTMPCFCHDDPLVW